MRVVPSVAIAIAITACDPGIRIGEPCEFNSDCPRELVCGHGRCRIACRVSRDCGPGQRCVQSEAGSPVCTLEREGSCASGAECAGALVCRGGECRTSCELGCSAEGRCEDGTCLEPRAGEDPSCSAPMVCGDGIVQGCRGAQQVALLRAILGHEGGEAQLLASHEIAGLRTPRIGDASLMPQIAIAGTASGGVPGLGVVAVVEGGSSEPRPGREPERFGRMHRFPLDDLSAVSAIPIPDEALNPVRSIALAEDGASIVGFWVADTPMPSGTGAWVTSYSGGTLDIRPLTAGDPPSDGYPRSAIVGGRSAMLDTNFARHMINREDRERRGEWIFGAVNSDLSAADYRIVTTGEEYPALLHTSGSPGPLMVTHAPGLPLAVWQVRRTVDVPIEQLDVAARDIAGPPTIALASAGGTDHIVGFPTPAGSVRFVQVICPATGSCRGTTEFATQASFGSGPTSIVRLARLRSGYAYAGLAELVERDEGGPVQLLHLAFLSEQGGMLDAFDRGTGTPGVLIPPGGVTGGRIVDVAIHAARGPDAITILVAALIRDEARLLDTIWLGGLRVCESP